jgi:hypothetical protein
MLQKIVFQDNIYHLCRSIDLVSEGLLLDLSADYYLDKTIDDILFFDASIQKLFAQIRENRQMSGYTDTIHSLHSCQTRYLALLDRMLSGKTAMQDECLPLMSKIQSIRNAHHSIREELEGTIRKSDKNADFRDIVSSNELSELLNF